MRVLIAGASSALGIASAAGLEGAGHTVIAVGSDAGRLDAVNKGLETGIHMGFMITTRF